MDAENQRLQGMLANLQERVRANERIWSGFREVETRLIAARSPAELVQTLCEAIPDTFPKVSRVTLALASADYEYRRLSRTHAAQVVAVDPAWLRSRLPEPVGVCLGPLDPETAGVLFPGTPVPVSAAVVPLVLRDQFIGSLNQGSLAADHFSPEQKADLLAHLAAVTALCIDNALNRERLRQDGLTDPLTGIANRRFFERRLHEEVLRRQRRFSELTCLLVDLDHFKRVNDRYGHQTGDVVLRAVASALTSGLRGHDVLARYGGEEFVLLLPDTGPKRAWEIAERLRQRVRDLRFDADGRAFGVTFSAGLAGLEPPGAETDVNEAALNLVKQTDAALYAAKRGGRDQIAEAGLRQEIVKNS